MKQRRELLENLNVVARRVNIAPEIADRSLCRDPAVDKFIHAALAAQPAWLVTGDKDLLVLAEGMVSAGVAIVSPADASAAPDFAGATSSAQDHRTKQ